MTRLAVPILILLLMLFAGAVWALFTYLDVPRVAGGRPAAVTEQTPPSTKEAARTGSPATADQQASFDVARVDPQGTSVFAGRAEPGSTVTVLGDGKPVGSAKADENGEWTLATEHPFASADPKLALNVKSAAETEAEKRAEPKVAGSLETHEAAKEPSKRQSASAVTTELLKSFEGIVAAARTQAEQEKKAVVPEPPPAVALQEAKPVDAPPMRLAAAAPEAPPTRKSIPVPITFVFDEAAFTGDGKKAAELLLEYLELKHFPRVTLTGHADERGTEELNMNLSRERLDTVAKFLKDGGYKGELDLIPKGESEPFTGVVRSQYSQEDLYQFDRRVELVISP